MAIDIRTGKPLPKGIICHQGGYLARLQFEGEKYSLTDDNLARLIIRFDDLKSDVRNGRYRKGSSMTFSTWYELWITNHRTPKGTKPRPSTIQNYNNSYKIYISNSFKKKKLNKITSKDVLKLFDDMAENGYTYNTIKTFRNMLSGVFTDAVDEGHISENPVHKAKIPLEDDKQEQRVLTVKEAVTFLEYAKTNELYFLFIMALETGMRCGELRALQWNDIDFEKRIVYVNHTLNYINKHYTLSSPKTGTSKRKIRMTNKLYDSLLVYKPLQQSIKEQMGNKWSPRDGIDNLVFCQTNGHPHAKAKIKKEIERILKTINNDGIPMEHFTPHTFRHTYVSICIMRGVNIKKIQKTLGHKDIRTTLNIYGHLLDEMDIEETDKLNGWDKL